MTEIREPNIGNGDNNREDRIVNLGLTPEELQIVQETHKKEKEKFAEGLKEKKVEFTAEQQELMGLVNITIQKIAERYGVHLSPRACEPTDIVPLLAADLKKYEAELGESSRNGNLPNYPGRYFPVFDRALVWYKKSSWRNDDRNAELVHTASHEMLHAKSFRLLQAFRDNNGNKSNREGQGSEPSLTATAKRIGLVAYKLGSDEKSDSTPFGDLNEAITESLSMEVTEEIVNGNMDKFKPTILWDIKKKIKIIHAEESAMYHGSRRPRGAGQIPQQLKETVLGLGKNLSDTEIAESVFNNADSGYRYQIPFFEIAYPNQRALFENIVKSICKNNPQYKDREADVKGMFYDAYFNGSMLGIARLLEETFPRPREENPNGDHRRSKKPIGKSTLRIIAEEPSSKELEKRLKKKA